MTQYTGRVTITIDGQRYRSKEGASLDTGGKVRDEAVSDAGVDGYTEKYAAPVVEFAINHKAGLSLAAIHATTGATLIYETDTGSIFTLRQAWSATPPKMAKGEVSCTFKAVECVEG